MAETSEKILTDGQIYVLARRRLLHMDKIIAFYEKEENLRKYWVWHIEKYGYPPAGEKYDFIRKEMAVE